MLQAAVCRAAGKAAELPGSTDLLLMALGFACGMWPRLALPGWCCNVRAALGRAAAEHGGDLSSVFYTFISCTGWGMGVLKSLCLEEFSFFRNRKEIHASKYPFFYHACLSLLYVIEQLGVLESPEGLKHNHLDPNAGFKYQDWDVAFHWVFTID